MKIGIVEDDDQTASAFAQLVEAYGKAHDLALTVARFTDGLNLIDHYQADFDVLYLDIQMTPMDGMTAAKKIRAVDPRVLIVFVTNYVQYAIEGYAVDATDFLLKPVTAFAFAEHFKKIQAKLAAREVPTLTIHVNAELVRLNLPDISFIESRGHYLTIHTAAQTYTLLEAMKKMEAQLAPHHFFRCNNSFLVNLQQVSGISGNQVELTTGQQLQISRPRKKAFMQALTDYLGDELV